MSDLGQAMNQAPRNLIFGQLRRDYAILPENVPAGIRLDDLVGREASASRMLLDVPGGSGLYASVGMLIWDPDPAPGLVARVGEDYPRHWLEMFARRGINVSSVQILPNALDVRSFYVITDKNTRQEDDPVPHFSRMEQPFPKTLVGYRTQEGRGNQPDSRTQMDVLSPRQSAILPEFLNATAAHFCPLDYLSHTLLPGLLRQQGFTTLTIDPPARAMNPILWEEIPAMLSGLTACLPAEEEVRALFHGRSTDLWEMAEGLASYGCEYIVIKRGPLGQILYDSVTKTRWEIPAYPARLVNPTGAGDSFCGGFLAGYRRTFDPLQAVLHGNIAASMVVEGSGAFFALDAMPGLAKARLDALVENVRKV
jgi:sugar/nucleoside kinase (ribokinase family)